MCTDNNYSYNLLLGALIIFLALFAGSCTSDDSSIDYADVSGINTDTLDFIRFDQLVMNMDTNDIEKAYLQTVTRYPRFTDLYFKRLLAIPNVNRDSFHSAIRQYITADEIEKLQDTINDIYPELEKLYPDFRLALAYLKFYFPDYALPDVYFMQTEFGYQNIIFSDMTKDGIGIGLDLFLGENFDYKLLDPRNPAFSDYLTRSYNREHIIRKSVAMILDDLMGQSNGKRFIDLAIHEGKKLYTLRRMLPMCHDTVVTEFSLEQLSWLTENELEMWSYFLEEELIYETNHLKIDKYINPSPHSPGMPPEAPGRTGSYIGWKIVEKYMSENPTKNISDLLAEKDAQKIMEMARYKPRRR